MRIGILTDFVDDGFAGMKVVIENLVKNLIQIDKKNEYYLIHYKESDNGIYKLGAKEIVIPGSSWKPLKLYWKLFSIKKAIGSYNLDLVHEISTIVPVLKERLIVTVYDVIPYIHPETFNWYQQLYFLLFYRKLFKRAAHIITCSNHSKGDIARLLKVPREKITVTYYGIHERFRVLNQKKYSNTLKNKYNLHEPYILYVGTLEPHKNVPALIRAYAKVREKMPKIKLVLVGKKAWKLTQTFKTIKELNLEGHVIFTGYVPDEDLPMFYNGAEVFVFPSKYEGFGFPPIEAMACGCPVITTKGGSLPEIVGDAGILVDPNDITGLVKSIELVLKDRALREKIVQKGLKRSKTFNWKNAAKETLKVYEKFSKERFGSNLKHA